MAFTAAEQQKLNKGIAEFYDESSGMWEDIWGDHLHHGFYDHNISGGVSLPDHRAAQIRMIEEALRFASLSGFLSSLLYVYGFFLFLLLTSLSDPYFLAFILSISTPSSLLSLSVKMKKAMSKANKFFDGGKKSKEEENVSSITEPQLREMREMIPLGYKVRPANETTLESNHNPSRPLIVHYNLVKMGWCFPIHPLLVEICNRYSIPHGQISSNSHESIFCFMAQSHKKGIEPSLDLFFSLFRPHKYDRDGGRGFVSFTAWMDMQFLESPSDKIDDWFCRFFVVMAPEGLPFPNVWRKKEDKFPS
ncbi:unnamed protein product [Cuscuta campestris]|uniref:Uncharacterized protein n=1 Tax=Cuscuta campestris TaxID=132261 RepID=A0A484LC36_9ASTE|nr:unnamed protein product [Cuscuta campestris]